MMAKGVPFRELAGKGAHLSILVTVFELMWLAMATAEATASPLRERSIASTGSSPLSCLIGSEWPSTQLPTLCAVGGGGLQSACNQHAISMQSVHPIAHPVRGGWRWL